MFNMTPHILRNLISRKPTRRYPREVRAPFEEVRGELVNDIEKCTYCQLCAVKCPSQCIRVDRKTASWTYDPSACIYCGICVEFCKEKCLQQKPVYGLPVSEKKIIHLKGQHGPKTKNQDAIR